MIVHKFEIGQKVFCARVSWGEDKVTCPDCLGSMKWTISCPSGEVFTHPCQTCKYGWQNTGLVSHWNDFARIVERTIGSIQIDTNSEAPVRYMCVETGVGTGGVYDERNLFAEEKDAIAWCDQELIRVKGLRQAEELKRRKNKKNEPCIYGKRKKKEAVKDDAKI